MKLSSFVAAFAMAVGVSFSTFAVVAPAHSAILTIDLSGDDSGILAGTPFASTLFDFHLVGPDGGSSDGIALTSASVFISGLGTFALSIPSFPAFINLDTLNNLAFLTTNPTNGGTSSPSDLVQVGLTPADITALQSHISFYATVPSSINFNGNTITTSGGALTFDEGASPRVFTISRNDVTSAVPELSTWAMMLIGFASIGFVGYRRAKKSSAAAAVT